MGNQLAIVERVKAELLDPIVDEIRSQLPDTVTLEKFRSAFIVAAQNDPKILSYEPNSVRNALIKCASDGLVPDGRLAAIMPFKDEESRGSKKAIYVPMVQGILRRAAEMGEAFRITCENVFQKDEFYYDRGGLEPPRHVPPSLGQDRGELVGAYVIFRDKNGGTIHVEIMDREEIEKSRKVSKAKNGPWHHWYEEMTRKTVIRRGSKYVPMSDAMRKIIGREDEHVQFPMIGKSDPNYNPLLPNQINGEAFSYDDLVPGLLCELARALGATESAPEFTSAEKEFWLSLPEPQPVFTEEENAKVAAIWQLNVDRIKKEIDLPAFYARLKEIIGFQESGTPRSGTPEVEGTSVQDSSAGQPSAGRGTGESSSPDLTPETAEQYEAYARNKVLKATDAAALGAWWKSKSEIELQKACKVGPELLQTLKKTVLEKIAELKPGRNIGAG